MICANNILELKKRFPGKWELLKLIEGFLEENQGKLEEVESESGLPTLLQKVGEQQLLLHSGYDPMHEAQLILESKEEEMETYKHVLFVGAGLGYHVQLFAQKYPDKEFSIYEPAIEAMYHFLSLHDISKKEFKNLKNIYLPQNAEDEAFFANQFAQTMKDSTFLFDFPVYGRVMNKEYTDFINSLKNAVMASRMNHSVFRAFEGRWVVNGIRNFKYVLQTPSILRKGREFFKGKPVILAAAGPSLALEFENLKKIKADGTAYIFAVGSAIKALVNNGIYPDAMVTMDPGTPNFLVFQDVVEKGITSIPMIFGTTCGFETLEYYKGPKLHMPFDQDTVSPYFIKDLESDAVEYIADAPSIAVSTAQLLATLGVKQVIFAGQNLAFLNNKYYAEGINHSFFNEEATVALAQSKDYQKYVEDVYGNQVSTMDGFTMAKIAMESIIRVFPDIAFINTTKGGAKIEGADFVPLETLMKETLLQTYEPWNFEGNERERYDKEYIMQSIEKMGKSKEKMEKNFKKIFAIFQQMNLEIDAKNKENLNQLFPKFDKEFAHLEKNLFYQMFVRSVDRVEYTYMLKRVTTIKNETDEFVKAQRTLEEFGRYIYRCKEDYLRVMKQEYENMILEMEEIIC